MNETNWQPITGSRPQSASRRSDKEARHKQPPGKAGRPAALLDEQELICLYQQGLSYGELARYFNVAPKTMSKNIRRLIREGEITIRRNSLADRGSQLVRAIVGMKSQKATLSQIGEALGVSKTMAGKYVSRIARLHGEEVFQPERFVLCERAAQRLQVSGARLQSACDQGKMPAICNIANRRTYLDCHHWAMVVKWLKDEMERKCAVCGAVFRLNNSGLARLTCSDRCKNKRHNQRLRERCRSSRPQCRLEWRRAVCLTLNGYIATDQEIWIERVRALEQSGLSIMQLKYLRWQNIVATCDHSRKTKRGKPVDLFSQNQMIIIRQILARVAQSD